MPSHSLYQYGFWNKAPSVRLKKGAMRGLPSERRVRAAGGAQQSTFPKNVVVGRLEEVDVVLHAAVGALRLLQPIPQVLEAALVSALGLHRGAQKRAERQQRSSCSCQNSSPKVLRRARISTAGDDITIDGAVIFIISAHSQLHSATRW